MPLAIGPATPGIDLANPASCGGWVIRDLFGIDVQYLLISLEPWIVYGDPLNPVDLTSPKVFEAEDMIRDRPCQLPAVAG
jgi:hypothetical protein